MSRKSFGVVEKAFVAETVSAFGFLTDEFGLVGPEVQGTVLPAVMFSGSVVRYSIMLDSDDKIVMTRIEVDVDTRRLVAELADLVQAAELDPRNKVAHNSPTLSSLQHALQSQAEYVRLLQPYMNGEGVIELMRKANAREWTIRR